MAAACGALTVHASQSPAPAKPAAVAAPTPRSADGHPDLNGIWHAPPPPEFVGLEQVFDLKAHKKPDGSIDVTFGNPVDAGKGRQQGDTNYLPRAIDQKLQEARAKDSNKPPYKPELLAKVKALEDKQSRNDPAFYCKPAGVPRMGPPDQIVQAPGRVVFLYASENTFRTIPTDGRGHRNNTYPTFRGDSVGHWEGNTLVVDVNQFTDESWLGVDGWIHSDAMHVIERFTRKGDMVAYDVTVEDPNVFTKPWVLATRTLKRGDMKKEQLEESEPCRELSGEFLVNDEHH
jgi:hypothetical protein